MTAADHRRKALHNERFVDETFGDFVAKATPYLDWVVTAIYYAAVHRVDEYLASQEEPIHPANHEERRRLVRALPDLRVISGDYRWLEDRSRDARYGGAVFQPQQVRNWRLNQLGKLKAHLERCITRIT